MSELEARTEIRHLRDMVYGLEQKIARLTAERDELQRKSDELALEFARDTKKILELKDERGRLTIIADAIQAERDRLRAALEEINRPFDQTMIGLETANLLRAIARRALEGK